MMTSYKGLIWNEHYKKYMQRIWTGSQQKKKEKETHENLFNINHNLKNAD